MWALKYNQRYLAKPCIRLKPTCMKTFTTINIYNSLTSKKEHLIQNEQEKNEKKILTWYSCGPTVYDDAHLGHARTYVCSDIIRRILSNSFNIDTNFIMGMTDVDDKIINKSKEMMMLNNNNNSTNTTDFLQIARKYENEFFNDMDALNIIRPTSVTRVSEYIPDIIKYIETIIDNGYGYESTNGVYFSCEQLGEQYGALARSKLDISTDQQVSESNNNNIKKDPRDFALWKKNNEDTNDAGWDSPWGHGRPGWHIECSAMTHSIVGDSIDIHSGGIDLKFPHHNNEIAQCQAHNNCMEWVDTFIHFGHVHIDGLKMSKSLKNFITIKELLGGDDNGGGETKVTADDFRLFCLLHHYRSNVTYSMDRIHDANVIRKILDGFLLDMYDLALKKQILEEEIVVDSNGTNNRKRWLESDITFFNQITNAKEEYLLSLGDDFNTPKAMQIIRDICHNTRKHIQDYDGGVDGENIPPSELLFNIHTWVDTSLKHLGLSTIGTNHINSTNDEDETSIKNDLTLLKSFAEFRCNIRNVARGMKKSEEKFELLDLCDHIRDDVFPKHGYQLRDDGNDEFTIRKL